MELNRPFLIRGLLTSYCRQSWWDFKASVIFVQIKSVELILYLPMKIEMFVICFAYNRSVQYTSNWSGKSNVMNSMITWVSVSSQLNTFYKSARSTKESIIWFKSQCLLPSSECAGERRTRSTIVRFWCDAPLQHMTCYLPCLACGKLGNRYKNLRAITIL